MSHDEYAEHVLPTGAARHRRAKVRASRTTLLVGGPPGVVTLHRQLLRQTRHAYRVIGCCLPSEGGIGEAFEGLPVLGGPDDILDVVHRYRVVTVAVLPSSELDGVALRRLAAALEPTGADLLLASAATGRPASGHDRGSVGVPHARRKPGPWLHGVHGPVKASFDRVAAMLALLLLAPVLLGVALCVKATSRGPVFVRHERVGRDGQLFPMLTFRTTEIDATTVDPLTARVRGDGGRREFRERPRETGVGSILRRYSIDELPQLLNVLKGDMSLVGPRPYLPSGIDRSGVDEQHRFPVKPGLTGLEQISGHAAPSGHDSPGLDGGYAENWSLALDLIIIRKTFGAVLRGDGRP